MFECFSIGLHGISFSGCKDKMRWKRWQWLNEEPHLRLAEPRDETLECCFALFPFRSDLESGGNVTAPAFLAGEMKWRWSCALALCSPPLCAQCHGTFCHFIGLQGVNKFSDWNLAEVAAAFPKVAPIFHVFCSLLKSLKVPGC